MNLKIQITGILDEKQIDSELKSLAMVKIEKVKVNSFNGIDVLIYLLTVDGSVTIIQLAKIIMKIMDKDKTKSLIIGETEIKGFSYKQTKKLLEMILNNETVGDISDENEGDT